MKRRVLMVVDLSNQAYKACAAFPYLSHEDRYTGGLYGYMQALAKAIRDEGVTHLVVGADSPPYIRSESYPDYKKLRKKDMDPGLRESASETIRYAREFHECIGIPVWSLPGFEFDDLVGVAVRDLRHRFDAIVAMTNDSDCAQFFTTPSFYMYRGKKGRYTLEDFKKDPDWAGIGPSDVVELLSMTGTHNDVGGIVGVGPKRAADAIRGVPNAVALVRPHQSVVDRNRALIELPHSQFPKDVGPPVAYTRSFNSRKVFSFCSMFGIQTTSSMLDSFEQVLS